MGIQKTNITIPRQPRSGLDVLMWAKDVNYAIKQLSGISANQSRPKKNGLFTFASTINHPWKVTRGANVGEGEDAVASWDVVGGSIYDHIASTAIDVADTNVSFDAGVIYLTVIREQSSREVIEGIIEFSEDILPEDYENTQHFPLAIVGGDPSILQLQFQEIKVFENLIVSNGELRYGNFQMMGIRNYDLPVIPE